MLPDYFVYEELRRRKEQEEMERRRPYLEVPQYIPMWPDKEREDEPSEPEEEKGVIIIQM